MRHPIFHLATGDKRSAEIGEEVAAAECEGVSGRSPDQGAVVTIPDSFRNCLTNPYLVQTPCQPPRRSPLGRIAVAGRRINRMSRKQPKNQFVGIRMTMVAAEALHGQVAVDDFRADPPSDHGTTRHQPHRSGDRGEH